MRDSRRRIRCLHFGQELKMPVDGNVPTHGHARRRWNGAVLFAEKPRRPGTTNGGGSFPSRLKGAEPSPSAPFSGGEGRLQRGWLRVDGHFQGAHLGPWASATTHYFPTLRQGSPSPSPTFHHQSCVQDPGHSQRGQQRRDLPSSYRDCWSITPTPNVAPHPFFIILHLAFAPLPPPDAICDIRLTENGCRCR